MGLLTNYLKKLIPTICILVVSSNVQAVVITATATADNRDGPPVAISNSTSTGSVRADASKFDPLGSTFSGPQTGSAYGNSFGDTNGNLFASSDGDGRFAATSGIKQSLVFRNNSSQAQNFTFDFKINSGLLRAFNNITLSGTDYISSGNRVSIKMNGVELFYSASELYVNRTGIANFNSTGTSLGSYVAGSNTYSWSPFTGTLDLGVFNAGTSFTLEYNIFTYANSNVRNSRKVCPAFDEANPSFTPCSPFAAQAYSEFSDPNSISSSPLSAATITGVPVNTVGVPEASPFMLLSLGLVGLAFARRRHSI